MNEDEIVWIYEQAKRHSTLYLGKVYAEQSSEVVLHAWQALEKQFYVAVISNSTNLTLSRNGLRTLRRYLMNVIQALEKSIIPGYKKRLDLPDGARYLSYIQAAENKKTALLEPLLLKIEREMR